MAQDALEESKRYRAQMDAKLQGRASLARKMREQGIEIAYLPENDYLTITIGSPRESVSLSMGGGIYFLVEPDSGEINAIEVPFFREMYVRGPLKGGEFWDLVYELTEAGRNEVLIPARGEQERTERAIERAVEDLVPA
jgi:hypothetical protein